MYKITILLTALLSIPLSSAQQQPDGVIVPFTSVLPACASTCGPLFDVQGKCAPSATARDVNCFCTDSRLTVFTSSQGTSGVSQVCGAASCTAEADLQTIRNWYANFCANTAVTSAASGPSATSTGPSTPSQSSGNSGSSGSSGAKQVSWIEGHYKWVIMIIVLFVVLGAIWILACVFRRRYLKKKEREFEMRPPVSMGPHQMQSMTGGYNYNEGIVDGNRGGKSVRPHNAEISVVAGPEVTPADSTRNNRASKGWLKKSRPT